MSDFCFFTPEKEQKLLVRFTQAVGIVKIVWSISYYSGDIIVNGLHNKRNVTKQLLFALSLQVPDNERA